VSGAVVPFEVYPGQDFYVPSFRLLVQDRELPVPVHDVLSVTYTDSDSDIDSFDLTLNNWEPGHGGQRGRFKYSDGDLITPWQDVELSMGYIINGSDDRRRMLLGEIVTMTPTFPAGGASTISVRGLNLLHRFRLKQKTETFRNEKDSAIARRLIAEINEQIAATIPNLRLQTDEDEIQSNLQQEIDIPTLEMSNEFPINFLYKRSKRIGYEITLEEAPQGSPRRVTFHYRRPDDVDQPAYQLEWGKTLISFQPSFRTADQVDRVTVRGWDRNAKEAIEVTVTRGELLSEGILDPTVDLKVQKRQAADRTEIVVDETVQTVAEARTVARRRMRQIAQGAVEARGKTIGLPALRAGTKIQVLALGRFSGLYQVTSTTHTINESGYTTDFAARMEKD
jgi:phage protein D